MVREPKLWITTRKVEGGRVISWRAGRKLLFQIAVDDGEFKDLGPPGLDTPIVQGLAPYLSPHGVPGWKVANP